MPLQATFSTEANDCFHRYSLLHYYSEIQHFKPKRHTDAIAIGESLHTPHPEKRLCGICITTPPLSSGTHKL